MILSCNQIKKSFVEEVVLESASFGIEEKEKLQLWGSMERGRPRLCSRLLWEISCEKGTLSSLKMRLLDIWLSIKNASLSADLSGSLSCKNRYHRHAGENYENGIPDGALSS